MEKKKKVDGSNKWARSPGHGLPSPPLRLAYLPPITALCLAPLSPSTPCRAPGRQWSKASLIRVYGAMQPTTTHHWLPRGGRSLSWASISQAFIKMSAGRCWGCRTVRQDLLLSCSPGRGAKAVGFLCACSRLSVFVAIFSQSASDGSRRQS